MPDVANQISPPELVTSLAAKLQIGDDLFFPGQNDVGGLEVVLEVHAGDRGLLFLGGLGLALGGLGFDGLGEGVAALGFLQFLSLAGRSHVADRGEHDVLGAQVLIDGLGFGGRLDDDEVFALGGAGGVIQAAGRAAALRPTRLAALAVHLKIDPDGGPERGRHRWRRQQQQGLRRLFVP